MCTITGSGNQTIVTSPILLGGATLVDETNLSVATHYYPDSTGRALGDYDFISLAFYLNGATLTVESPVEKESPYTNWSDITNAGYCLNLDSTSAGPYTSTYGSPITRVVDWERLSTGRYRIKIVPTGATNQILVTVEERFV
jgi:hypothetical protein